PIDDPVELVELRAVPSRDHGRASRAGGVHGRPRKTVGKSIAVDVAETGDRGAEVLVDGPVVVPQLIERSAAERSNHAMLVAEIGRARHADDQVIQTVAVEVRYGGDRCAESIVWLDTGEVHEDLSGATGDHAHPADLGPF